jgi:transketolase
MTATATSVDQLCINTIRALSMDTVQKAKSGHPGMPLGAAPMAYTLWTRFLKHNPTDPHWPDRDRFVLSAGHASALLYSLLTLTGYDLQLDELKEFRQFGSRTPGHPEYRHTPGAEVTTGPLGQGFANAVGFAIAERVLAARFNRPGHEVVDHYTYCMCSDGDLMEGISSEAASLAGTLGLGKLVYLYDSNNVSLDGPIDLSFTEDVGARFRAYGWHVQSIDGMNVDAVTEALEAARGVTDRPSLIVAHTVIGFGSPHKAGTSAAHGSPLGDEEVKLSKEALGWPSDKTFYVPDEALQEFRKALPAGQAHQQQWELRMASYAADHPADAALFRTLVAGELPAGWTDQLPGFSSVDGQVSTRIASGRVLNAIAPKLPTLIGGSADLSTSNETTLKGYQSFGIEGWSGRNINFGVREHAMGAILNGMNVHGGVTAYGGTFLTFSDYMRGSIRLAALMQAHSLFVYTHDSIGLGEDGPTHQPVEHLAALRAMPGLRVIRPADANESAAAWKLAIESAGPSVLVFSRQNLPVLDDVARVHAGTAQGGYVLIDSPGVPDVILIGTGSEVSIVVEAGKALVQSGVQARVVSMPSWEVFDAQPAAYRDSVLPPAIRARVAVEAGVSMGWERYVGESGAFVGIEHFGASAPATVLYKEFGITAEAVVAHATRVLEQLREGR